jgi:hypothetical protein
MPDPAFEGHRLETMSEPHVSPRAVFLVECFAPASAQDDPIEAADRVGAACADLRAEADIVYLGALIVSDDELAFHIFAAANADLVLEVSRHASLRVERVVQCVAVCRPPARAFARQVLPVQVEPERPIAHAPGEIGP